MKSKLIGILAIMILLAIILGIMFIPTEKTSDGFQDIQNWETYDHSKNSIGFYLEGYTGTIVEKKMVYFVSHDSGYGKHGEVLRYDTTQEFDSVEAWSTFDPSRNGVGYNAVGYSGIVSDGQFLYFVPYHNHENFHGEVLRYDTTQEFDSVEAWSTFDPSKNGVGYDATGYWGGTFDGQFVYFSPRTNSGGNHGEVLRYDTTQEFDSVEAWSTFYASETGNYGDRTGYWGAVYADGAIYFAPSYQNKFPHGDVLKYNIVR